MLVGISFRSGANKTISDGQQTWQHLATKLGATTPIWALFFHHMLVISMKMTVHLAILAA
jgi:hypothetical protein